MNHDTEHTDEELRKCSRRNWEIMEECRDAALDFITRRPHNDQLLRAFVAAVYSEIAIRHTIDIRQINVSAS